MSSSIITNNTIMIPCQEDEKGQLFHFIISGCLTALTVLFGICGTLYSCGILVKQGTRFSKLLLTLCLWDLTVLISAFGFYGMVTLIKGNKTWTGYFVYLYLIFYPICNWSMTGSKLVLVHIALERYWAITSPFLQRVREAKPMLPIQLITIVISLIANLPSFFELTVIDCIEHPPLFTVKPQIWPTKLRSDKTYSLVYRVIIRSVFESLLPFMGVLFLTLKTLFGSRNLHSSNIPLKVDFRVRSHAFSETSVSCNNNGSGSIYRSSVSNSEHSVQRKISQISNPHVRITTLLTGVIIKFLICYSLPTMMNVLEFIDTQITDPTTYGYLVDISNFIVVLNSSTNWLLYCHWRKENRKLSVYRRRATKDLIMANMKWAEFEQSQIMNLVRLWRDVDKNDFGLKLIEPICKERHDLSRFVQVKDNQEASSTTSKEIEDLGHGPPCYTGQILSNFIDEAINSLVTEDHEAICRRIREIGYVHYQADIPFKNADWLAIKKRFVQILIEKNTSDRKLEVVNKFASFLIREMKFGFTCKAFIGNS